MQQEWGAAGSLRAAARSRWAVSPAADAEAVLPVVYPAGTHYVCENMHSIRELSGSQRMLVDCGALCAEARKTLTLSSPTAASLIEHTFPECVLCSGLVLGARNMGLQQRRPLPRQENPGIYLSNQVILLKGIWLNEYQCGGPWLIFCCYLWL